MSLKNLMPDSKYMINPYDKSQWFYHSSRSKVSFTEFKRPFKSLMSEEPILNPIFLSESIEFSKQWGVAGMRYKCNIESSAKLFDYLNRNDVESVLNSLIDESLIIEKLGISRTYTPEEIIDKYITRGSYEILESNEMIQWYEENGYDGFYVVEYERDNDYRNLGILNLDIIKNLQQIQQ